VLIDGKNETERLTEVLLDEVICLMYNIDRDYDLWLQQQGKFEALDVDNLV